MRLFLTFAAFALYFAVASAQVNENLVNLLWTNINLVRQAPEVDQECVNSVVFRAMFSLYDTDGDGRVLREEFVPRWRGATNMTEADTNALFDMIKRIGGSGNPNTIDLNDVQAFYYTFTRNETTGCITEANFKARWREVLNELPDKGAQVPPTVVVVDASGEYWIELEG